MKTNSLLLFLIFTFIIEKTINQTAIQYNKYEVMEEGDYLTSTLKSISSRITYLAYCNNTKCYSDSNKPQGTYLDITQGKFEYCYAVCGSCSAMGNSSIHNCDTCKDSSYIKQPLNPKNCVKKCSSNSYWYLDENNIYKCTSGYSCPSNRAILITESSSAVEPNQCVEDCKENGSCVLCRTKTLYEFNKTCVENCPLNTLAILGDHQCVDDDNCKFENYTSNIPLSNLATSIDAIALNYSKMYSNIEKQVTMIKGNSNEYTVVLFELEE